MSISWLRMGTIVVWTVWMTPTTKSEVTYRFSGIHYSASINSDLAYGNTCERPASNCSQVLCNARAESGFYWLTDGQGKLQRTYCAFSPPDCGGVGIWRRVGWLDMSARSADCPGSLIVRYQKDRAFCRSAGNQCLSATFTTGTAYSEVCGMVRGFQQLHTNGFYRKSNILTLTTNDNYVDGVSFTRGTKSKHHLWTYAATENENHCRTRPPFVGSHYYCESTAENGNTGYSQFNTENALWDNVGYCSGPTCRNPNQPWFRRKLGEQVSDDLEMRLCVDEFGINEIIAIDKMELYVRED